MSPARAKEAFLRHPLLWSLAAGALFTALLLSVSEIRFADWPVPLQNTQRHTPVASWGVPTVAVLAAVGLLGYLLLRLVPLPKLPPLAAVLAMAALYLGCGVCLFWIAQVFTARY